MDYKLYTKKDLFNYIFFIHIILEIISWLSFLMFSWWLILLGFILMHLQFKIFGTCILNIAQFKKHKGDSVFLYPYVRMLGINISFEKMRLLMRYILPLILITIAVIWQILLENSPIFF